MKNEEKTGCNGLKKKKKSLHFPSTTPQWTKAQKNVKKRKLE